MNDTNILILTNHAKRRLQQRGFSHSDVETILQHGIPYHAGRRLGAATAYWFTDRSLRTLVEREKHEHLANSAVVISPEGAVITVFHVRQRPRHWKAA